MIAYLLVAATAVLTILLGIFSLPIAGATGIPVAIVRAAVYLLGAAAIAAILVFRKRINEAVPGANGASAKTPNAAALDDLLREAESKLARSARSGAKSLRAIPMLYVLGDTGSAKTTAVLKSGLEPELLAGQVYREQDVVPTAVANIWYTQRAAIVEAGELLRSDAALWSRLLARTRPASSRSAFAGGAPFRAAIVCVSCEQFLGATSSEAVQAAAAAIGEPLRQLATALGTQLPVYVLLTKLDRVPGFAEYVRNLSFEEASELLGAAPGAVSTASAYLENATASALAAYDGLVFALGGARLDLLAREADPARLSPAYEFPRELRKLRNHLATYLVELVRPSHLNSNPYLRGFYFTGVRAFLRQQAVSNPVQAPAAAAMDPGATGVFAFQPPVAPAPAQPAFSTASEKVAQWAFLSHFFPDTVLGDTSALSNTAQTNHATLFRRIVYASCASLVLLYLLLLTVSYFRNAALEREIESASAALAASPSSTSTLASAEQLTLLDALRLHLLQLEDFHRDGAPLSYRWGLYSGDRLLAPARRLYFAHFRTLLLDRTQTNMLATLQALPSAPPPGAEYNGTYSTLRGYLITTGNPEKSKADFLTPVLSRLWTASAPVSPEQTRLAERQFDFYANELPSANPYTIPPAMPAVTHARAYLNSFGGIERIYQSMLTAAEKAGPAINFNAAHPRSLEYVVEPHTIQPAFTKTGYGFMQDALAHPDRFFSGEPWVLGDQAPPSIDLGPVRQQLTARYQADYLAQWRAFVKDASVVRYTNLKDAGARLTVLAGNNSPLLALFATVSQNTSVPNPEIAVAFQAPQAFVPGTSADVLIGPSNKSYIDALLALNGSIAQVAGNPAGAADPAAATPISASATAAHLAAQQSAQVFHIDPVAHVDASTLALMEAPITSAEGLVRGIGPAAAGAAGKSFCAVYNTLFSKQPFAPNSSVQASPAEVTAVFQPGTGSLWQFYNANLKAVLIQQGVDFVQAPNAPMQINPAFAHFFSRAAQLSNAFFPPGSTAPALTFVLRNLPSAGIQSSDVKLDAQSLTNTEAGKQFNWNAITSTSASLTANNLPLQFTGPWAVFQLFSKAKAQHTAGAYDLSFPLEVANTPVKAPDGTPVVAHFELSGPGADLLAPNALANLKCVANVAAGK